MRTIALIKRILLQIVRDKRTLALLFIAPLIILTLMYLVFNGKTVNPAIGVENIDQQIIAQLEDKGIEIKQFKHVSDSEQLLISHDLDAFLKTENKQLILTLLNSDPAAAQGLQLKIKQAASASLQTQAMTKSTSEMTPPSEQTIQTKYVYGNSDSKFFDVFSPALIGFFVFFFVFLISGIGLLKERTTGTLERLLATPIRRGEIVAAYLIGFGIFAVLQTIVIVFYSINVLNIVLAGSIWNVILVNLILALVALSLGILLSSFAASEFQMMQFIPIAVVPQIFFSGILPLEGMADWLQIIARLMPLYYAADALNAVMYKGLGLSDISTDIYILTAFAAIFIMLNLFALKKYRKL